MVEIRLELENFVFHLFALQCRPEVLRVGRRKNRASRENEYLSEWMDASKDRNYCEAVLRR